MQQVYSITQFRCYKYERHYDIKIYFLMTFLTLI